MRNITVIYHHFVILHQKNTLWSIRDKDGTEYIWQGDGQYWEDRAPNLFPYIARMTKGRYTLKGKTYKMDIHGFVKDMMFKAKKVSETHIIFTIMYTEETYQQYPYKFSFSIIYKLEDNKIKITYWVDNDDDKTMYFGIGAHPGFNVPLEDRAVFEDYYLEFDSVSEVKRVGFSKDCFVTGELFDFPLEDDVRISLSHHLFDKDAIVLTNVPRSVTLKSNTCNKGIRVIYPAMHYLGIWHMPKTDAPYVCIEPWSSLPSRKDVVEDIETQPELVALKNGCEYKNQCCIEFLRNKE